MNWLCAQCGSFAKTNRKKCLRCGSAHWKPAAKKDVTELAGHIKRMAPKGLLLVNPAVGTSIQDSGSVECGKCRMVIYKADHGFDESAFQQARENHYSNSPECKKQK